MGFAESIDTWRPKQHGMWVMS